MAIVLEHFKHKLEAERALLVEELSEVARKNPKDPSEWETVRGDMNVAPSDREEMADELEDFGERSALGSELGMQLKRVESALLRITDKTYGLCRICGKEIELARLEANPSAETCKEHLRS